MVLTVVTVEGGARRLWKLEKPRNDSSWSVWKEAAPPTPGDPSGSSHPRMCGSKPPSFGVCYSIPRRPRRPPPRPIPGVRLHQPSAGDRTHGHDSLAARGSGLTDAHSRVPEGGAGSTCLGPFLWAPHQHACSCLGGCQRELMAVHRAEPENRQEGLLTCGEEKGGMAGKGQGGQPMWGDRDPGLGAASCAVTDQGLAVGSQPSLCHPSQRPGLGPGPGERENWQRGKSALGVPGGGRAG